MSDSNLVRSIFVRRFSTRPPAYITPRLHYWCSPQPTHYPAIDDRWGGARIEMYVGCYSYDLMINFRVKYRVRYQYHAQVSPMTFQIPEHFLFFYKFTADIFTIIHISSKESIHTYGQQFLLHKTYYLFPLLSLFYYCVLLFSLVYSIGMVPFSTPFFQWLK